MLLLKNYVIVINKKLRHSRITSSSCSHNTRVELGLRVRDNTRVELDVRDNTRVELDVRDNTRAVKPRGSLSGTLGGIPGGGERGPRVTRGHVGWKSTHGAWVWHAAWTPRG